MNAQRGFTLVELLVTMTVAAILLAAAAPSLRDLIQNNRATAYANELVLAMTIARAEALKRPGPVTVCAAGAPDPVTGIPGCAGTAAWEQGWIVFQDAATTGAPNPGGASAELIRVWPGVPGLQASVASGSLPRAVRFDRQGAAAVFPANASTTLRLQSEGCRGEQSRELQISRMGRVSVVRKGCA
jgi:type IV fimbrial biogenesis protein FimT